MNIEDDLPKKKPQIIVGEPLDTLSVADLAQRIEDLETEIERVRQAMIRKQAGKTAADAFFRR